MTPDFVFSKLMVLVFINKIIGFVMILSDSYGIAAFENCLVVASAMENCWFSPA